ncbi:Uncharacterised protein [Mycobacteroides abscessus]|nr:Uncharacterised protein [Mycobacteroides abscessus]
MPGRDVAIPRYSAAMPGTGTRALECRTNVFHAAMNGRGTAVTIAVSSMSETTPSRRPSATTNTRPVAVAPAEVRNETSCQPGARSTSITRSR